MARRRRLVCGIDWVCLVDFAPTADLVSRMITYVCDSMEPAGKSAFCKISRAFPIDCRNFCKGFVADKDQTPERLAIWVHHVVGPAQAQAEAAIAEPGSVNAV